MAYPYRQKLSRRGKRLWYFLQSFGRDNREITLDTKRFTAIHTTFRSSRVRWRLENFTTLIEMAVYAGASLRRAINPSAIHRTKKMRLYILPQYRANLTKPIDT